MAFIELKNLSISFDETPILSGVDLNIEQGQSCVFLGPSGLGKTTLLKTIAGLLRPTSGELWIGSENFLTQTAKERKLLIKRMGMLFQKNALFDSFSCAENIAFPLRETTELSPEKIDEKVRFFLEAVGLSQAYSLYPDEISGGMQKRLGIARALALDPEIIFYDDPTAGLDPITSKKIIELILLLKGKNQSTVLTVTNDIQRAYQLADTIYFVFKNEVLRAGSPSETKAHSDPRIQQFIHGLEQGPLTIPEEFEL